MRGEPPGPYVLCFFLVGPMQVVVGFRETSLLRRVLKYRDNVTDKSAEPVRQLPDLVNCRRVIGPGVLEEALNSFLELSSFVPSAHNLLFFERQDFYTPPSVFLKIGELR